MLPPRTDCNVPVDLAFLIDGSGSVSSTQFRQATDFAKTVSFAFNIGASETRVAIAQFSSSEALFSRTVRTCTDHSPFG